MTQTPTDALRLVPVEPTEAVLTNMAIRFDHGLGCPRYYDNPIFGEPNHARRFEAAKTTMRQLYEEVVLSAAAPASPLPGGVWRTDFENAPDCEEGILIVDATKISPAVGTARFIDGEWCGYDHGHGVECLWPSPTHWMPLPSPPSEVQK